MTPLQALDALRDLCDDQREQFDELAYPIRTELESVKKGCDELIVALQYSVKQVPELATVPGIATALAKLGADKTGSAADPNCTCDEHGACTYCWNGKKHDGYSDGMSPKDDREFLSKTSGLDGPIDGLSADQDCGIRYVE